MKQQEISRNRLWLTVFFAGIIALIIAASTWWTMGSKPVPDQAPRQASAPKQPATAAQAPPAVDAIGLKLLRDDLMREAAARKVSETTIDKALAGLAPDTEIATLHANQPEFVKSAGEYVDLLVSETRIANGRFKLAEYDTILRAIEAKYGVDRHVLVAIWGVESSYGTALGEKAVVRSLATLAMNDQRRASFWRAELLGALAIIERGDSSADRMLGSWAGAMGHTQFMPTTYNAHAVDFDGDGRRDIWGTPADALASAANYLKSSGWVAGQPSAVEVVLPPGFDLGLSAPHIIRSAAEWRALDVAPAIAGALPDSIPNLSLVLPAGANGPAFLTSANFRAILRYNNATAYALAVSHLAGRLAGGGPLSKPWPADDRALSRADREELQTRLQTLGYDVGAGVDGVIGTGTRNAIRAFQRARALPEDGHPNLILLQALRKAAENRMSAP